jgi:hypothetical protein
VAAIKGLSLSLSFENLAEVAKEISLLSLFLMAAAAIKGFSLSFENLAAVAKEVSLSLSLENLVAAFLFLYYNLWKGERASCFFLYSNRP